MFELSHYALNALLVCIAIAFLWIVLKTAASLIGFSYKAVKYPFNGLNKPNQRERVVYITNINDKKILNASHKQKPDTMVKTIPLTQFAEKKDWSSYDIPAYLRNDIVIH